jgi:hypothetical protein
MLEIHSVYVCLSPDKAKPSVRGGTESGGSFQKMAELPKDDSLVVLAFLMQTSFSEPWEGGINHG